MIADLGWRFDCRVVGVDYADEDGVGRLEKLTDDLQDAFAVGLAGHLQVEAAYVQLEEVGQQEGVVDVGAVGGIVVGAGADVNADVEALLWGEAIEDLVVECDETAQEASRGIELER